MGAKYTTRAACSYSACLLTSPREAFFFMCGAHVLKQRLKDGLTSVKSVSQRRLSKLARKIYPSHPCRFDSSTVADDSAELRVGGGSLSPNYMRQKQRLTEPEQENTCSLKCVSPDFRAEVVKRSTPPQRRTAKQTRS